MSTQQKAHSCNLIRKQKHSEVLVTKKPSLYVLLSNIMVSYQMLNKQENTLKL